MTWCLGATTAAGTAAVETAPAIPVAVQVRAEERGRRRRPSGGRDGGGSERGGGEAAEVGLAVQPRAKQVSLKVPFIFIFKKAERSKRRIHATSLSQNCA